jgi:two-component system chemotaxis response regulator CheB
MPKVRVLIVDDSAYSRQAIRKALEKDPHIEVAGISTDGIDAMAKTIMFKPDLITLDLEMPGMDGFTFLRWLMKKRPTPVIIVSSYSDSKTVFKALDLGAADFIAKPQKIAQLDFEKMQVDLLHKVRGIKDLRMDRLSRNIALLEEEKQEEKSFAMSDQGVEAIAIGSSTGGPNALKIIMTRLPSDFQASIVISQHMPKGFTASFAERLNGLSQIQVEEAKDGDIVEGGKVLICPGGHHMLFRRKGKRVFTTIKESKHSDKYIPSIDTMMSSASEVFGSRMMGIVLTGMGNDGVSGMLEIKKRGGYTIAESEDSAVVFGMPSGVINAGAAGRVLPISEIPDEMIKLTNMKEQGDN